MSTKISVIFTIISIPSFTVVGDLQKLVISLQGRLEKLEKSPAQSSGKTAPVPVKQVEKKPEPQDDDDDVDL